MLVIVRKGKVLLPGKRTAGITDDQGNRGIEKIGDSEVPIAVTIQVNEHERPRSISGRN